MFSDLNIHMNHAIAVEHEAVREHAPLAPARAWGEAFRTRRPDGPTIAIRPAYGDEQEVVADIALLDSARPLIGPVLLAVVDGWPVAAGSLADDRVVANPMVPTGDAVALLRERMSHLRAERRPRRGRRARLLTRLAT
jgi:hypothetical protein